jgi:acetolactate synthase-1/3 small subunit
MAYVDIFVGASSTLRNTIELTGNGAKLDAFIQAIEPSTILETVRSGASGIARGERILKV